MYNRLWNRWIVLQHYVQELGRDTTLPAKQALLLEEHEMRLRLALAKNLGAALTREGDSATLGPVEVF